MRLSDQKNRLLYCIRLEIEMNFDVSEQEKVFPTIAFFVRAQYHFVSDPLEREVRISASQFVSKNLYTSFQEEPSSTLLFSLLEILHEELVQACKEKRLEKACMEDCKILSKENHTIISHLFRGHMKRKVICPCGFVKIINTSFTEVSVPIEDMEEKLLILHFVGMNSKKKFAVTRYLFSVTAYTNVEFLKEKMVEVLKNDVDANAEDLEICLVKDGHLQPLENSMKVFEVMCENGVISVYHTTVGDFRCNLLMSLGQSSNTLCSEKTDDRIASTSTPTTNLDASDLNSRAWDVDKVRNIPRKRGFNAEIILQFVFPTELSTHATVLRFPRISNGLHVFERLSRIFGFHYSQYQSMTLTITNKVGQCIFCLSPCCPGCPAQLNDKIVLSHHFILTVVFEDSSLVKFFDIQDHPSYLVNKPIKILTLMECFSGFIQRINSAPCPSCASTSWKYMETLAMKPPPLVICHLPVLSESEYILRYPVERFSSKQLRRTLKGVYCLQSMITSGGDQSAFIRDEKDNSRWLLKSSDSQDEVNKLPNCQIELLIYEWKKEKLSDSFRAQMKLSKRIRSTRRLGSKTKFSARNGQLIRGLRCKSPSHAAADTTSGRYTTISTHNSFDQESTCTCSRCHTLDKLQEHYSACYEPLWLNIVISAKILHSRCSSQFSKTSDTVDRKSMSSCCLAKCGANSKDITANSWLTTQSDVSFPAEIKLHAAVRKKNLKGIVKSLNDGADVNHLLKGTAALHLTAAMGPPFGFVFTKLCLECGGDANLLSSEGLTPVHVAVMWGREDTLTLLLQNGGVPAVKNAHGKSAFDVLLQANNGKSESMLRLLRGEVEKENVTSNKDHVEADTSVDDISLLHVSEVAKGEQGMIGETTFDEVFQLPTLDEERASNDGGSLKESVVSQHFTDIDDSNPSFNGSRRNTWLSFFLCSGRFSKIRRRQNEDRWITRVTRSRIRRWFDGLFR